MSQRTAAIICILPVLLAAAVPTASAADLLVGAASADITPQKPVALCGQFNLRIARTTETPLTANVVALESRAGDKPLDAAVVVSCDVVVIPDELLALVRDQTHKLVPELDVKKIIVNATHTHTAPVLSPDEYAIPKEGVMQVDEYRALFAGRVAEAIARAWKGRKPGSITWGLGHAVVGYNRRTVYADGSAQMYGATGRPEFRNLEGYEDHDVGTLFFWNGAGKPAAVAVNVACPSQEVEGRSAVNADYWHPVREGLRKKYGQDVCVLGWPGASGDQSPHLMYRHAADERMRRLRGLERMDEIARRIVRAVDEAYEVVEKDRRADVTLVHKVETLRLPMRLVSEAECAAAKAEVAAAAAKIEKDPKAADQEYRRMKWYEETVKRFERQKTDPKPTFEMELHVVRIGDAVVCANPFELFTDYGIRVQARSKAEQTFVVDLAGPGGYLPTEKAVRGGGYSAIVESSLVGPEGGQMMVEKTLEMIGAMWK